MNCIDINEKMSLYIDNLLDDSERALFEQHLSECKSCSETYEMIISNIKMCHMVPEVSLPLGFKEDLHNRLIAEQRKKKKAQKDWRPYGVVAAAVLVMFISAIQGQFFNKTESTQDIAKAERSNIGSKWTLANDSDEKLMEKMKGSDMYMADSAVPEMAEAEAEASAEDTQFYGIQSAKDEKGLVPPSTKTFQGHITAHDTSIDALTVFLEQFSEYHDNISIHTETQIRSDIPEITIEMPPELFHDYLYFISEYPEITGYQVDIVNYSDMYSDKVAQVTSLEHMLGNMQYDYESKSEGIDKENLKVKIDALNIQISEKNNEIQKLLNEASKAYIEIEITQ